MYKFYCMWSMAHFNMLTVGEGGLFPQEGITKLINLFKPHTWALSVRWFSDFQANVPSNDSASD